MSRPLRLVGQAVALAAVAGLLGLLVWRVTHQTHAPKVGSPAPSFSLKRLEGSGTLTLASLRGKPVVLNFWASWCVPCKAEAKTLEQAWNRYEPKGVAFVGIDYHDVTSDARTFLSHHGVTYPTVQDGSGAVGARYGITGVPETFVVGRTGKIVVHIAGPIAGATFTEEFRRGLEAAMST
jgi:cytochrome c biogenesis protein CcmG, thiol:disulfide interchange protein DsbE